jgi:hypothetical protein
MSFKYYEEGSDDLDLDVLTIAYYSHVSHPRRSGMVGKINHLRAIY